MKCNYYLLFSLTKSGNLRLSEGKEITDNREDTRIQKKENFDYSLSRVVFVLDFIGRRGKDV